MRNKSYKNLYRAGQQYAKRLKKLRAGGISQRAAELQIAKTHGIKADHVKIAVAFAAAVDQIVGNCGSKSRRLLLSGISRLPVQTVMQISRTHADRQQFELVQVKSGRSALTKPPLGVSPPFDTHNCAEVLNRLGRNTGAVAAVADGLLAASPKSWPPNDKFSLILSHLKRIRQSIRAMKPIVLKADLSRSIGNTTVKPPKRRTETGQKQTSPAKALSSVARVAGVTEKNLRDLPRVMVETPPTATEKSRLLLGLQALDSAAARLQAVILAGNHDNRMAPSNVPGTYIMFFELHHPIEQLKIGRLGTYDFQPGIYGYIGSAFGAGGLRDRTDRHLNLHVTKLWNIDFLKSACTPVESWWTYDRSKREFVWAALLRSMPFASCPIKGFGAADNNNAEAHLVMFPSLPSITAFRRRARRSLPGHAPIFHNVIENWIGNGWPE